MYLTHQKYLNALYINAVKLYPFFITVAKSINLQQYEERVYWEFLEKLKEKGVIRFQVDRKGLGNKRLNERNENKHSLIKGRNYMTKAQSFKRKTKKLRLIKDYKNHHFVLMISVNKIKEELQKLIIFKKFFIPDPNS